MSLKLLFVMLLALGFPVQSQYLFGNECAGCYRSTAAELSRKISRSFDMAPIDAPAGSEQTDGRKDTNTKDFSTLSIKMSLDGFWVLPTYIQMNATFSVVYQFEIGDDGHPMHIYALRDKSPGWSEDPEDLCLIDPKAAENSIRKWKFVGFEKHKKYVLVLNWEHMVGWVSMFIHSDQVTLSIRLLQRKG